MGCGILPGDRFGPELQTVTPLFAAKTAIWTIVRWSLMNTIIRQVAMALPCEAGVKGLLKAAGVE
jgi:hypothetical protein